MVGLTMTWLSDKKNRASFRTRSFFHHHGSGNPNPTTLGILAFEAAKAMARIVFLYTSLSDEEFTKLRKGAVKSKAVSILNSKDENFLLNLACVEKLEDLNQAARTVSRLGKRCTNSEFNVFDATFESMKQGNLDSVEKPKNVEKMIKQMQKYISSTSSLHSLLGTLKDLEISEKKIEKLKENESLTNFQRMNLEVFEEKIAFHRKQIRHFKETSLWSLTFEKCVELMSKIMAVVFVRICVVFGPFVPTLPCISTVDPHHTRFHISNPMRIKPEPTCGFPKVKNQFLHRTTSMIVTRKQQMGPDPTRINRSEEKGFGFRISSGAVTGNGNSAFSTTVGGAGLAVRYANVIVMAERYFNFPAIINEEARVYLYGMLPENLKRRVKGKLKCRHRGRRTEGVGGKVEDIMTWLGPIAQDTIKWQQERNLEKQRFDAEPTVLLLQTLHFSDLEKTEAAIVEVLVGLSCVNSLEKPAIWGDFPGTI